MYKASAVVSSNSASLEELAPVDTHNQENQNLASGVAVIGHSIRALGRTNRSSEPRAKSEESILRKFNNCFTNYLKNYEIQMQSMYKL